MATANQVSAHAKAWVDIANELKSAFVLARQLSIHNAINDPNWNDLANQIPAAVSDGVVIGTEVAPSDVANAIGSVNQFLAFMDGSGGTTGSAWINNLEKIAKPIV